MLAALWNATFDLVVDIPRLVEPSSAHFLHMPQYNFAFFVLQFRLRAAAYSEFLSA